MQYVAITQGTAAWLLSHSSIMDALHATLTGDDLSPLCVSEFSSGPLRMVGSADGRVLSIWNKEYVSGTGSEAWGIFKLNGPHGLLGYPNISQQVFERLLYILNQRLQGLIIDGELIHRQWKNGSHTCLAGRGSEARQFSIAYFEGGSGSTNIASRAVIAIGPQHDFDFLQNGVDIELPVFPALVEVANGLTDSGRRRPLLETPAYQKLRACLTTSHSERVHLADVNIPTEFPSAPNGSSAYEKLHWDYTRWLQSGSLNNAQRRVLTSDGLTRHPVRVIGPAGSGKTLLMQLLALRYLYEAQDNNREIQVLYIVHNAAMAQSVTDRLRALGAEDFLTGSKQSLVVATLSEYGRKLIGISEKNVVDKDAHKTKQFQYEQVKLALKAAIDESSEITDKETPLLYQVRSGGVLFDVLANLVMAEISSVIKGRGLADDEKRYTDAQTPLSRLHRILKFKERAVVFDCFRRYHNVVFEQYEMLDSDDVALTLAGRLRTPLWNLKRKTEGFDYIFVDEAQLFNENERRVFPFLSKGATGHVPIALALDEAQEPFGFSTAGLATLGITDVESESLPSNHRSTCEIIDLAFHVIQQTTDLFGSEFPDFTGVNSGLALSGHALSSPPIIVSCNEEAKSYGRFLVKLAQKLRAKNIRQIAVICHAEGYWSEMVEAFEQSQLPLHVITQRGEKISPDQPLVVLSRPAFIGGQEFDAAILVGLEQGLTPPRVDDNPALAAALEQQMLREIYLGVTRARYRVIAALNHGARPNAILHEAEALGLIKYGAPN